VSLSSLNSLTNPCAFQISDLEEKHKKSSHFPNYKPQFGEKKSATNPSASHIPLD
jgi:hypothetical protein